MGRYFYLGFGWLCVALGGVGIIIPILPTTPFLLVAVWAFSKSSPELAQRIRNHPKVGCYVRDWQDYGVVPVGGKIAACLMMLAMGAYLIWFSDAPQWAALVACGVMLIAAVYVVSRPSRRVDLS